ncbi:phosphatase PAP2 family protein [Mesorhizobium sp. MSK_1335]|uniref:Phosphatase PAP2 family protein n=1 Tax=Mesorhizobium montanum TaxID=3072323 RepID=A0ABU4ZQ27_9HYPH|nr:phosphatase PAP2 family protein [Mesorhizobium sp. MSK_1335]MDX8527137.1 phosphatase PAP2 family protein [Mesorhizobium sp. MSK_1335]
MGSLDDSIMGSGLPGRPQSRSDQPADIEHIAYISRKLLVFCLLYIAVATLVWPRAYYQIAQHYLSLFMIWGLLSVFVVIIPAAVINSPRSPIGFLVISLRSNGLRASIVLTVFILSLAAFTTYKVNIPAIVPFYSDKALADIGEFLHGRAAWRIAHAFDSDALALLVAATYSKIWFLEWFGMVLLAALNANQLLHLRYLVALACVTMVVGTLMAALFSSVGPIFYDEFLGGARYADLLEVLRQHPYNEHVLQYSDYLLRNYKASNPALGSGISAMPSMHVAVATLNAFYLTRLNRWLGLAGWAFAIFILFGSIYTGWHYSVDGYISMLVVAVTWRRTAGIFDGERGASGSTTGAMCPASAT